MLPDLKSEGKIDPLPPNNFSSVQLRSITHDRLMSPYSRCSFSILKLQNKVGCGLFFFCSILVHLVKLVVNKFYNGNQCKH